MALTNNTAFHYGANASGASYGLLNPGARQVANFRRIDTFSYDFEVFFHPFVGNLIAQLNTADIAGMLDPTFLNGLTQDASWFWGDYNKVTPASNTVGVVPNPKNIDVSIGGPYANYNWELIYHIPVMIAVNLSNNQRFNEAQKWFHLVFDPTSTDVNVPPPLRYWKCLAFRNNPDILSINSLLQLLSTPDNLGLSPAQQACKGSGFNRLQRHAARPLPASCHCPYENRRLPVVRGDEVSRQPDRLGRQPVLARHHRDTQ